MDPGSTAISMNSDTTTTSGNANGVSATAALASRDLWRDFISAEDIASISTLVGPDAHPRSFPRLIQLLRDASAAEHEAVQATLREARFSTSVIHGIVQVSH